MRKSAFVTAALLTACLVFGWGLKPAVFAAKDGAKKKAQTEEPAVKVKINFGKQQTPAPVETPEPEPAPTPEEKEAAQPADQPKAAPEKNTPGEPVPVTILPPDDSPRQIPEAWEKIYVYYWGKYTLNIGYSVEDKGAGVQTIELWMTADAGATWKCAVSHNTINPPFVLQIPNDGVYGFKTVASDKAGFAENKPTPGALPDLVIVVDTVAPKLQMAPLGKNIFRGGEKWTLTWNVIDATFKMDSFKLEFSLDNVATWFPILDKLSIDKNGRGALIWTVPRQANAEKCFLRATAADYAGNTASETLRPSFAINIDPPKCKVKAPAFTDKHDFDLAIEQDQNSPAEVAKVVLYYTTDDGKNWKENETLEGKQANVKFSVAADCKVGFLTVASDAYGNSAEPPVANTPPQCFTIVDSLPPAVKLINFNKHASYPGGGSKNIEWDIQDPNMSKPTVKIEFSLDDGKTWQLIVEEHSNTGRFLWHIPKVDSNTAKIKISAEDDFQHVGVAVSEESFLIDSQPPKSIAVFEGSERTPVEPAATPAVTPQPVKTPVPPTPVKTPEPVKSPIPTPAQPKPVATPQPPVKSPAVTPTAPVKTPEPPKTPMPPKNTEPVKTQPPVKPVEPIKTTPPEKTPVVTPATTPTPEKNPSVEKTPVPGPEKTPPTNQTSEAENPAPVKTPATVDVNQIIGLKLDKIKLVIDAGRYSEALEQLKALESDHPDSYSVIIAIIDVLQKQKSPGNQDSLAAYFAKAMEINKFDRLLYKKAGVYYYNLKKYDQAEACFNKACGLAGAGAQEFLFLGQTQHLNAKNLEAEKYLKKALEMAFEEDKNSIQAQCYWYLAEIAGQNNNTKEALDYWKKAEAKYGSNSIFGKRAKERYIEQLKKSR